MAIQSVLLKINDVAIDLNNNNIRLNSLVPWRRDQTSSFTFTQESGLPRPVDPWINKPVRLWINGALVFSGRMQRRVTAFNETIGWSYGYEAAGDELAMSMMPVVSPFDGTGAVTFNLSPRDNNYDPTYAGLTIGRMIRLILETPSTAAALQAVGIGGYTVTGGVYTLNSVTLADLAGDFHLGQYKPNVPVLFQGDDLLQAIRAALQAVAPNHTVYFEYRETGGTLVRFKSLIAASGGPKIESRFDLHPPPELHRDYSRSYPRVVVRGGVNVQPMLLSLSKGEISEDFTFPPWYTTTAAAKANWTLSVWQQQTGRKIPGRVWNVRPRSPSNPNEIDPTIPDPNNPGGPNITNPNYIADPLDKRLSSPQYAYFDPDPPPANVPEYTWNATAWNQTANGYGGNLFLTRVSANNPLWKETVIRQVVDNTNLTSGGKSYLQLSENLPQTDFSNGTLTASRWPGLQTWRKYKINARMIDGTPIAKRVQATFPSPISWVFPDGSQTSLLSTGLAQIIFRNTSNQTLSGYIGFQVDRQTESIVFDRPVVTVFGTSTNLQKGGNSTDGIPTDIQVLLPVAISPLEVAAPPNNGTNAVYAGTSYSVDGLIRTKYVNNRDFISTADSAMMQQWATQFHDSVKDTVVEGTATRYEYLPVLGPGTIMTWSDPCFPPGTYDSLTTDVRGCMIKWNHGQPVTVSTHYDLSNRREPYTDDASLVYHPCVYPLPQVETPGLTVRSDYGGTDGVYDGARNAMSDAALNTAAVQQGIAEMETGRAQNAELAAAEAIITGKTQGATGNWDNFMTDQARTGNWQEFMSDDGNI